MFTDLYYLLWSGIPVLVKPLTSHLSSLNLDFSGCFYRNKEDVTVLEIKS